MKPVKSIALLAAVVATAQSAQSATLFTAGFEDPVVTGLTMTVPTGWIGSNQGFNSNRRGIANEDIGTFSTPFGSQAALVYFFNNAGLTTEPGAIGPLMASTTYTVSFNVANLSDSATDTYELQLVAFTPGEIRNDPRGNAFGTILGISTGEVTSSNMSEVYSFDFTAMPGDPSIGQDLAVRIRSVESNEVLFDNILVESNAVVPEPSRIALLGIGALVALSRRRRASSLPSFSR